MGNTYHDANSVPGDSTCNLDKEHLRTRHNTHTSALVVGNGTQVGGFVRSSRTLPPSPCRAFVVHSVPFAQSSFHMTVSGNHIPLYPLEAPDNLVWRLEVTLQGSHSGHNTELLLGC